MQVIEDRDAAVQQLTDVMWKFTSYIGKRLPTDVTHKLADLRAKETHPLAKAVYQSMKDNQDAAEMLRSRRVRRTPWGGWLGSLYEFPSSMAQNFWVAINAWTVCFVVTIVVSLVGKARPDGELVGLVYGVTPHTAEAAVWYKRPAVLAMVAGGICIALNFIFF